MYWTQTSPFRAAFPKRPGKRQCVFEEHRLIPPASVVEEVSLIVKHHCPNMTPVIEQLLSSMSCEFVYTPSATDSGGTDASPLLRAALQENADVVITCNRSLKRFQMDRPEVLTPSEFLRRFVIR